MKDLGKLSYCLGLSVMQRDDSVTIHQRQYIDNLVARFNLTDANTVSTPADPSVQLVINDGISQPVEQKKFQQLIGSLQ